jgi:hypothetical protein
MVRVLFTTVAEAVAHHDSGDDLSSPDRMNYHATRAVRPRQVLFGPHRPHRPHHGLQPDSER